MTLEQSRAAMAFRHVQELVGDDEKKLYGAMAQKLPVLIRTAGLCQALHFVKSRDKPALNRLLNHLALQVQRADAGITEKESLCDRARQAELTQYLLLTREALASIAWYARLAQSELGVERGAVDTTP